MPHEEHHHPRKENLQSQNRNLSEILQETNPFTIDKCKFKNAASVSEELALFNGRSGLGGGGGVNLTD